MPPSDGDLTLDDFLSLLASICEEAAVLCLDGSPPAGEDAEPTPQWVAESRYWTDKFGSTDPAAWVSECSSAYLVEAAHQCLAIGSLLRAKAVAAALDPLVRAVIERAGRIKWILDTQADADVRAARAGHELGVSLQYYREVLARLGADDDVRKQVKAMASAQREQVVAWFDTDRPPGDPCDESSKPTKDISRWTVAGGTYPTLTRIAQIAVAYGDTSSGQAAGTYDGLSGFAHPSVVFGREHRKIDADGAVTYRYEPADLEKHVRFAAFCFLDAYRHWAAYYGLAQSETQARIDAIEARLDQYSALRDGDSSSGT